MTLNYNIGMGQMLVVGGVYQENLSRALKMVQVAREKDCSIVVLPETLDTGWLHPNLHEMAKPIPGATSDILCQAAQDNGVYIVAGITEKDGHKLYNTAILIDQNGEILLKYRKIHILDWVLDIYSVGTTLSVVETPLGTIGVNICADNFMNSLTLAHSMARMGADIILSPVAWTTEGTNDNTEQPYGDIWLKPYKTISELYDIAIVGATSVGVMDYGLWKGRKLPGKSLAVWAGGTQIMEGPYGIDAEALVVVPVTVKTKREMGTALTDMLKEKGYEGP